MKAKKVTDIVTLCTVFSKYDNVQDLGPEYKRFRDIPQVLTDVESFLMGLQTLEGFDKDDKERSEVLINPKDQKEINDAIIRLYKKGMAIIAEGKRTGKPAVVVFACYYGGHGT